jgi:protein subunit release factor B
MLRAHDPLRVLARSWRAPSGIVGPKVVRMPMFWRSNVLPLGLEHIGRGVASRPVSGGSSGKLRVPAGAVQWKYSRSSGKGGQNVNKVNTKAELRFVVDEATWIPEQVRERFLGVASNRINKEGEFVIQSDTERTQNGNKQSCLKKLEDMLARAAIAPKDRLESVEPEWVGEHRLQKKHHHSEKKKGRRATKSDWE